MMLNNARHLIRRSLLISSVAVIGVSIRSLMGADAPTTSPSAAPSTHPATMPVVAIVSSPAVPNAAIDHLIVQLGSDSADDRDAAQKKLEDAGGRSRDSPRSKKPPRKTAIPRSAAAPPMRWLR